MMIQVFGLPTVSEPASAALEWVKALAPIIGSLIAVFGVCLTILYTSKKSRQDARYDYAAKALDLRLRQLNDFYAPLRLQLEQSRVLYDKLLWSLERLGKRNPDALIQLDGFRLLDHAYDILNRHEYIEVRPLVQSILKIGDQMSAVIAANAGLVEGGITTTLIEYRAHLEMLKAAAAQPPLPEDAEGWQEFGYYPRILNREVTEGYKEVLRHFEVFQEAGDDIVWTLLGRVPESRRKSFRQLIENLTYYERNVKAYAKKFDPFDLSELRDTLKAALPVNTPDGNSEPPRLLDAGCGTGRDAVGFISSGFEVFAFDISPAMVRLCKRKIRKLNESQKVEVGTSVSKSSCVEMSFDEVRFRNEFDAVWASASLLHVPKKEFVPVVQKLIQSLKLQGVIFMSFKYGVGEAEFDSRHYSYFRRSELHRLLSDIPNTSILKIWLTDAAGKSVSSCRAAAASWKLAISHKSQLWVNVLVRKVPS